jgi:GntR family transcriptional regulator
MAPTVVRIKPWVSSPGAYCVSGSNRNALVLPVCLGLVDCLLQVFDARFVERWDGLRAPGDPGLVRHVPDAPARVLALQPVTLGIMVDSARPEPGMDAYGDLVSVDHDAETPLWLQLANILRGQIQSGELAPGRIVPSETTLMQEHGVARGTVRKAIDALAEEGLVNRVQGRGTFVRGDLPRR